MKKHLLLIATALLVAGCARQPEYECKFTLNGETHLIFNFKNVNTPKSFSFFYNQSFPADQHHYLFSVEHDTIIEYTLPLNHPAEAPCQCYDMGFTMFLVQNEPLTVNIDIANETFTFEGFTKPICEYLTEHPTDLFEDYSTGGFAKIDKVHQQQQKDLKSAFVAGKLPKWFFDLQTENLLFTNTTLKKEYVASPNQMEELRKSTPIRECKYYWLQSYAQELFLRNDPKFDSKGSSSEYYERTQNNLDIIKAHLPEDIVSYYTASRLSVFLIFLQKAKSVSDYEQLNEYLNKLLAENSSQIKDTAMLNYIVNEQKNIHNDMLTRNTLKPGDKAPTFYLKNVDDKNVSLSDFAGNLVLLNFWDTHCMPCIASIPIKNALVEKFGKQGFELVNICLDDAPDVWRQIISDHHPLGEQLICKGQWEKTLREKYMISSRPHFVLVDRNGLIIANHVKGDSLEFYIERNIGNK